ncbi:MAG TPA: helix-turn-helix transcriptional regulator, partial [Thermomicrobiales bacterium]|nr:helix-turn-helix transcriptional regulator [Thermomicrobiales bacterium]
GNRGRFRHGLAAMEQGLAELEALPAEYRPWDGGQLALARVATLLPGADRPASAPAAGPALPGALRQRATLANWYGLAGRYREAEALGAATVAAARGLAAFRHDVPGRWGLAHAHAALGRPDEARREYARARADCYAINSLYSVNIVIWLELLLVVLPYQADDPAERRRLATEAARAWAHVQGTTIVTPYPSQAELLLALPEGRWAEARELARAGRAGTSGHAQGAITALATLARLQGEPERAWAQVRELHPEGPNSEPGDCHFALGIAALELGAELALDAGDLAEARAWLVAHDRWLAWADAVLGRAEGALGWAAYHRAAGDFALAREHAAAALAAAADPRQPLALLAARRLLGELDTAAGRHADAAAHLADALALADACAAPYERALTLLALTELRAATGEREAAGVALAEARAILDPLEARPALARADALAARLAAPGAPPPARPAGLTAREAEVLRLVAAGLSDAQVAAQLFVSPHTVNAHLRSIYGKLGVTSRAAATRFALEHHLA